MGVIGGSPSAEPSALGMEKKAAASSNSCERDSSDTDPDWSCAAPILSPGADRSAAPLFGCIMPMFEMGVIICCQT